MVSLDADVRDGMPAKLGKSREHTSNLQSEAGQGVSRQEVMSVAITAPRSHTVAP